MLWETHEPPKWVWDECEHLQECRYRQISSLILGIFRDVSEECHVIGLGSVHTTPEKSQNAALSLWLRLPSTLIRHDNANWKRFSVEKNSLKEEENYNAKIIIWFSCPCFPHKSNMNGDCCIIKFLRWNVDGKHDAFSEWYLRFQTIRGLRWLKIILFPVNLNWPFRNSSGNWGEFQILTNR